MPRNSSGACTVDQPAFTPNTSITSAAANANNDDFASMLTDSLSRSGKGGMQAALQLAVSGFAYSADPDTGMSRSAANTQVITVGGSDYTFTASDLTAPGGASLLPLVGEIRMWALPTAPTGWIFMRGQACTTTYPLWRAALIAAGNPYGTSGGDPKFPNLQCRLPAGFDADGLGLLTGSTTLGNEIGEQSEIIAQANLPNYTLPNTIGVSDTRTLAVNTSNYGLPGGPGATQPVSDLAGAPNTQEPVVVTSGSIDITGSVTSGGSGTALSVVQPTLILNFIGRAA